MYDFENSEAVFPSVHRSYKFSLLTLGTSPQAEFVCFATQVPQVYDSRRRFQMEPDDFTLINPNTRTCPIFRSERDAELTKKLYRAAPVLIREAQIGSEGEQLEAEVNSWGIRFQTLFHMSNDSGLFLDSPTSESRCLPLYEAKMIHQFDHRWATYVDAPDKPNGLDTEDVRVEQKADPAFSVRPRYWVPEREVLGRIASVPARVSRAWLAWHSTAVASAARDGAFEELLLALAAWVAGELFFRTAGDPDEGKQTGRTGWSQQRVLSNIQTTEIQLKARFEPLSKALLGVGLTTKKAVVEFPKWALQNISAHLSDGELATLSEVLRQVDMSNTLLGLMDEWMNARSPNWLLGWRRNARSTDERTTISAVMPRSAQGDSIFLFSFPGGARPELIAAFQGCLGSLAFDFVARQKVGGVNFSFYFMKQLPVLPPESYSTDALQFIVPRVLELSYTAHDLRDWADELRAYDPRGESEKSEPFAWSVQRRSKLRADLDAYYARLYGLTREELQYILDPVEIMGQDYPSETFRVLKEREAEPGGGYRTQRLVLEAWDAQTESLRTRGTVC